MFVLHGHITAVKSLSFCSSGLALVSGGIGGLLNIWSLQVREHHSLLLPFPQLMSQPLIVITLMMTDLSPQVTRPLSEVSLSLSVLAGWFGLTDRYRDGVGRQHLLDTRFGRSCLLWEVEGNAGDL